jgi:hypothetical protein
VGVDAHEHGLRVEVARDAPRLSEQLDGIDMTEIRRSNVTPGASGMAIAPRRSMGHERVSGRVDDDRDPCHDAVMESGTKADDVTSTPRPHTHRIPRICLFAATLVSACQPQPAPSALPPATSAAAPTVASSAGDPAPLTLGSATASAPVASAAPSPPPARRGLLARRSHRRRDDGTCPDHERAMSAGRKRTLSGDHQGALEAFTEALRAQPLDARAWAELGYAALLAGYDARWELHIARSLTKDRTLLAQIWFNEGLAEERFGDVDAARRAFVLAEVHGSTAVEKKLAGASRCAATWTTDPERRDDLTFVRSWREALAAAGPRCTDEAPPKTEAEAKRTLCAGCTNMATPGTKDDCVGPGPWMIDLGYFQAHGFGALVQPLAGGRFFVESFIDEGGGARLASSGDALTRETPAYADGLSTGMSLSEPGAPSVTNADYWSDDAPGEDSDGGTSCPPLLKGEVEPPRARCMQCFWPELPLSQPRQIHYYAPSTGRELLRLRVWNGDVKATIRGATATIAGGGCQATITLPAR